jgi:formamidopyrimidine-DNA glycosylase
MPELPEVQTTVNGLSKTVVRLRIVGAWSDYNSAYFKGSGNIKDPRYFKKFGKEIAGKKIVKVTRRAKNILIHLNNGKIILIHMKMTGHLLYGDYDFDPRNDKQSWIPVSPESLKDLCNRHVHFVLTFSNNKRLALSDSRKFAKVTLIDSKQMRESEHLKNIGPEPLEKGFTLDKFKNRLSLRPNGKIKQVLMNQSVIAGIGNIYADESLWRAGIHPLERVRNIPPVKIKLLFEAVKKTLFRGINFGGDSMSDYRNIHGQKGRFHEQHHVYQMTGIKCQKRGCGGTIRRIMVGSRSAHYCDRHQKLSNKR